MGMMTVVAILAQAAAVQPSTLVERAIGSGIRDGVFPGAVVVIGTRDSILYASGFGHFTWSPKSAVPSPDSTLFDIASLTKVTATTPSIMYLVERGLVRLDRPVRDYLPEFAGEGKENVLVWNLLAHNSGLRAFLRLDTLAKDSAGARKVLMAEALRWKPGARVEYSDLNAMLLGFIVERVTGVRQDLFASSTIFSAIGMSQTTFLPPKSLHRRTMPTNNWRGTPISGAVNDQNAARLGGVAGHAGLFSTASDLARYAQVYLRGGVLSNGRRLFLDGTIAEFTKSAAKGRALGWESRDTATADNAGRRMSAATYGHTGFTGTSIWIDPVNGVFAIVLTNRVYSTRNRRPFPRIKEIRGQVADAAVAFVDRPAILR